MQPSASPLENLEKAWISLASDYSGGWGRGGSISLLIFNVAPISSLKQAADSLHATGRRFILKFTSFTPQLNYSQEHLDKKYFKILILKYSVHTAALQHNAG